MHFFVSVSSLTQAGRTAPLSQKFFPGCPGGWGHKCCWQSVWCRAITTQWGNAQREGMAGFLTPWFLWLKNSDGENKHCQQHSQGAGDADLHCRDAAWPRHSSKQSWFVLQSFHAKMSWGMHFPPKFTLPHHIWLEIECLGGVSLIQYTTQNTEGSLKCKVWGTGTGKGFDCWEGVGELRWCGKRQIHWTCFFPLVLPALSRMRGSSWTFIFENGNKKEIRWCYHFHFEIERKPWYSSYSFTADAMLTNSTEVAGWQLYCWWHNLLDLLLRKVFPVRS